MGKVYYNQADSRWANYPYPADADGYRDKTVKTSGCGPTCAAMVISSCKEAIQPDTMCDISRQNGFRVAGGTSDELFSYIAQRWGLEMKRVYSSYEAHQACKEGYYVVIACKVGLWTTGGHYILAVGANDTDIEIYDPYLYNGKFEAYGRSGKVRLEGTSAWVQIDTFKAYSNAQRFFAFKVSDSTSVQPTNDPAVKYVNTSSANLNVRSSAGGSVVGSLPKGTQVLVYEESNGWSRIGDNKWVSSSYLSDAQPSSSTTNRETVGQTKKFKNATVLYSNSDLTGTTYNYKANTSCKILENTSTTVDKVNIPATNRTAYVAISAYSDSSTSNTTPTIPNTVGQTKVFSTATTIYSNSNLTGTQYQYKANTSVKVLANISTTIDKIYVIQTGRIGYINKNVYK
jgi:hypothetical protein